MRFTCAASELQAALMTVTKALASKSTLPILEGVLLDASSDGIRLTCSDSSITIITDVPAMVDEPGRIVLPGRLFTEVVRKMPSGEIFAENKSGNVVTLKCMGSRTNITGMDAAQFPQLPVVESDDEITLPQPMLKDMITRTSFAIAVEDTRQVLTGCLLEVKGGEARMVAVDGYRLAMRTAKVSDVDMKLSAIVPGKALSELAKLLSDDEGSRVALCADKNMMHASVPSTEIYMRLIDGEFIDYRRILPALWKSRITVDCGQMKSCVDRASLMAREGKNNLIKLEVSGEDLHITSNSEIGDVHEQMEVEHEGDDITIAFNVKYIIDAVRAIDDDTVTMRFVSGITPCVLAPVEGDSYLYLVLPVRINA